MIRARHERSDGRDEEDASASPLHEAGEKELRERRQGKEVHGKKLAVFGKGSFGERALPSKPSVVDEVVHAEAKALHFVEDFLWCRRLGKILGQDMHPHAVAKLQFCLQRQKAFLSAGHQDEVATSGGMQAGKFFSEAARSARDECGLFLFHIDSHWVLFPPLSVGKMLLPRQAIWENAS